MRPASTYLRKGSSYDAKLTPLIDVVFLLLVFFVWTSSFRVAEQSLPSQLTVQQGGSAQNPNTPPPPETDFEMVVIEVQGDGPTVRYRISERDLESLAELQQRLKTISDVNRDVPVAIRPSPETQLGHVIEVFDVARIVGFTKVQFAAKAS